MRDNVLVYTSADRIINDKSTVLGTGMKLVLLDDGKIIDIVSVAVTGDLDGDGYVTTSDVVLFSKQLQKPGSITYAQFRAADMSGDGKVTIDDYLQFIKLL